MSQLIMMRHGQSMWNQANLFTGWVDVPLSQQGIEEALTAGDKIKDIDIDVIFVSSLIRSHLTAMLTMAKHSSGKVPYIVHDKGDQISQWSQNYGENFSENTIPVFEAWELNERMYGHLQGLNKKETAQKYGKDQVKLWRRSYDTSPPEGESLAMTKERVIPYFKEEVVPFLEEGKNVLISAHGNSLRAVVMELESLSKEQVLSLEIPTGVPLMYAYNQGTFKKQN